MAESREARWSSAQTWPGGPGETPSLLSPRVRAVRATCSWRQPAPPPSDCPGENCTRPRNGKQEGGERDREKERGVGGEGFSGSFSLFAERYCELNIVGAVYQPKALRSALEAARLRPLGHGAEGDSRWSLLGTKRTETPRSRVGGGAGTGCSWSHLPWQLCPPHPEPPQTSAGADSTQGEAAWVHGSDFCNQVGLTPQASGSSGIKN